MFTQNKYKYITFNIFLIYRYFSIIYFFSPFFFIREFPPLSSLYLSLSNIPIHISHIQFRILIILSSFLIISPLPYHFSSSILFIHLFSSSLIIFLFPNFPFVHHSKAPRI